MIESCQNSFILFHYRYIRDTNIYYYAAMGLKSIRKRVVL